MKKLFLCLLACGIFNINLQSQDTWEIDLVHSYIGFDVTYMEIIPFHGKFTKVEGLVTASNEDFSDMDIKAKIDVSSINTGSEKREKHLKSTDFFDAEQHPNMTFHSNKVEKVKMGKEEKLKVTGDLTIRGITKSVELIGNFHSEPINDPWGHVKTGCSFRGTINRQDFGISYGQVLDSGALAIDNNVDLVLDIVLMKDR